MMAALALAGAVVALSCQISEQLLSVRAPDAAWKSGSVPIDAGDKPKFAFSIAPGTNDQVVAKTATDVMSIAGSWSKLDIAPGQYAFVAPAKSCVFTESFCMAMVQVSAMPGGTAAVAVTVSGSARTEGRELRDHLQLMFLGECKSAALEPAK